MSRHRDESLRLRPARAVGFAVSLALTMLAVVGAAGLIPTPSVADATRPPDTRPPDTGSSATGSSASGWTSLPPLASLADRLQELGPEARAAPERSPGRADGLTGSPAAQTLPTGSGAGRRVVFDMSAQQVWLVRDGGSVLDTYPVSGSTLDNLSPGRYAVYSRSPRATSFDYSSTMRWMVRFTQGARAAIGFHAIPRDSAGEPLQTLDQLGTAQSVGCIRQRPRDAKTLWDFAPVGTPVVVVT